MARDNGPRRKPPVGAIRHSSQYQNTQHTTVNNHQGSSEDEDDEPETTTTTTGDVGSSHSTTNTTNPTIAPTNASTTATSGTNTGATTIGATTEKSQTKRATLTESQKYEVCAYLHDQATTHATHLTNKAVAQYIETRYSIKVNESTVSRLRAQSANRLAQGVTNPELKRHRAVMFPELEKRLTEFVNESKGKFVLTDGVITARAKELAKELGIEQKGSGGGGESGEGGGLGFSDGWLFKFKVRHGMRPALGSSASGSSSTPAGAVASGSGTGFSSSPAVIPTTVATVAASGSAIPEQQQQQEQKQSPKKATRSRAKRQRIDVVASESGGESAGGVEGLNIVGINIDGINIEEIIPTATAAASETSPKLRRKSTRKGSATAAVEDPISTTTVEEDHSELAAGRGRGRRKAGASSPSVPRNKDTLSSGVAAGEDDHQQQLLEIGLDMELELDSHVRMESAIDVEDAQDPLRDASIEHHLTDLTAATAARRHQQQQQQQHLQSTAGGGSVSSGPDPPCPVTQMEILSKAYGNGSSMTMSTSVEQQQQHLSLEQQQQHQQNQLQRQHQQHQQLHQRATRQQHQQQQQQQAANELMAGVTFTGHNKSHKSAVPPHSADGLTTQPSMDAAGHSIPTATTTTVTMPMSAAMAMTASTAVPSSQSSLTGLELTGATSVVGNIAHPSTVPHQQHQLHHPQQHQQVHHDHQLQQAQAQALPLRLPPPTTASRAALSLSIVDPIAASFQPEPPIDFAEAAQCVYTLRLFMQQQSFSRNQVDQLHAIYLTLDMKRKERLQQQQQQQQPQMKE